MENDMTIVPNQAELEKQFEFVNSLIERHRSLESYNKSKYIIHLSDPHLFAEYPI